MPRQQKNQLSLYLTVELRERLEAAAEREHRTPSNLMQLLLMQYLKEHDDSNGR
jgi:predicted DNA-binding protein